jgi:2-C-methyl-D-erythritol 4-phosphate cytidylyltransferase
MAVALLVAAGSGERLGAGRPKAFVTLAGRPMLEWSLIALRAAGIQEVVIAAPPAREDGVERATEVAWAIGPPMGIRVVQGGVTRSASVRAALAAASPRRRPVVVHDAARPLVDPSLFTRTLAALSQADCAIAAARVTDTVKQADAYGQVTATLDRSTLWAVQTPQAFRRGALERALAVGDDVLAQATDDAWLVERAGGTVRVVESSPANLKVTTRHDLQIAELLLRERC